MVIAIASTKGGVGKSTLSMQFLHAMVLRKKEKKVMIFDADAQATCLGWSRKRAEYGLSYLEVQPLAATGMAAILASKQKDYDVIFIDVGGTDNKALRVALVLADVVIVPTWQDPTVREHTFDMMTLVHEARELNPKMRCMVLFNFVRHTKERHAIDAFKEGFPPYIIWFHQLVDQRKVISRVYPFGKTVYDIALASKGEVSVDEATAAAKARADIDGVLDELTMILEATHE
jgi:chromosome partitioning protein